MEEESVSPSLPEDEKPQDETPKKETGLTYSLYYWLQTLVLAVVAIVLVFTFVGRVTRVVGSSMLNTLHDGDLLLVQSLCYTPQSGDIVVLNKTSADFLQGEAIVKRIIATSGQQVDIDYSTGTVYVDGMPLDEPYIREAMMPPDDLFMAQTSFYVPEGSIFVMGDNRNASTDSRDIRLGFIDEDYILGKAVAVLFPLSDFGTL